MAHDDHADGLAVAQQRHDERLRSRAPMRARAASVALRRRLGVADRASWRARVHHRGARGTAPPVDAARVAPAVAPRRPSAWPTRPGASCPPSTPDSTRGRSHRTAAAASTMASNTGCESVGEPPMTCSISAVAVCRSSASCVSLNRRTFSIAITAWSAKVCSSAELRRRRTARLRARHARSRRCARRLPQHRHGQARCASRPARRRVLDASSGVVGQTSAIVRPCARSRRPAPWSMPRPACAGRRARAFRVACGRAGSARRCSISPSNRHDAARDARRTAARAARRSLSNTGCDVGRRAADDAQDLGRRGLPLQRLLRLVEQAHVLDRDHRLVGEGLAAGRPGAREASRARRHATPMDADGTLSASIGALIMRPPAAGRRSAVARRGRSARRSTLTASRDRMTRPARSARSAASGRARARRASAGQLRVATRWTRRPS